MLQGNIAADNTSKSPAGYTEEKYLDRFSAVSVLRWRLFASAGRLSKLHSFPDKFIARL
ncbi:hypothetical protein [Cesiribacter sp. SM1]|uniref:hypothetical protein n=1 Tax=Cesiribacter sp. SM1 TaxID=2861196 RepID=UPI001CD451D1|nr:hypothetical protein [Cesiribacter sp. SM1]